MGKTTAEHDDGFGNVQNTAGGITPTAAPLQRSYGVVAISQISKFKKSETATLSQLVFASTTSMY